MKAKRFIILFFVIIFTLILIPLGLASLYADPLTSDSDLNLYQGWGISSDSYVKFGKFDGKDILWRVLRQADGVNGAKLISDEILTTRQFDSLVDDLWDSSDIRAWLNNDFYNGLGTDKNYIQLTNIATVGIPTQDKIFLPGWEEMLNSPFDNDQNSGDLKRAAAYSGQIMFSYWLRDVVNFSPISPYVVDSYLVGCYINTFYPANENGIGVRPVLYLKKGLFFTGNGTISDPYFISNTTNLESTAQVWVRPMPMTCWQVWINEDNNFQFIFWYPYKDKNWVRIYDMEDNMVFEVDLPVHDPNLIVDLPDGFYIVKTFHNGEPLQEFLIGKP